MSNWRLCTCSEAEKKACRATQYAGIPEERRGEYWADIGIHPSWLRCGRMGEIA